MKNVTRRAVLCAFAVLALCAPAAVAQQPRPNVIFILADDVGWGDLACYGSGQIKTPNLDKLARQGTLFTQFYVANPVCSPSRAAFLTGRFPARLSLHGHLATPELNRKRAMPNWLDPAVPTLTRLLQSAGYAIGHYGKWHLGSGPDAPGPDAYGIAEARIDGGTAGKKWDVWNSREPAKSSERIVDEVIGFIERSRNRPFYVNAWLLDTHAILNPSEEQMAPYAHLTVKGVPFKSPAQIYAAAATEADRQIGRLLAKLDELGLAENTIVVFSSDNRPEDIAIQNAAHSGVGSAGPFRGRKRSIYEGGVRVPFIVRWPKGTPAGKVNDTSVISGVDFLPTLCALADVPLPAEAAKEMDGENRAATLKGDQTVTRARPLFWEWRFLVFNHPWNRSPMLAIREGKWKLLMNPDRSRVELYDIPADSGEQNNIADKHSNIVKRLGDRLLAWHRTLPEGPTDPGAGRNGYPWPKETAAASETSR